MASSQMGSQLQICRQPLRLPSTVPLSFFFSLCFFYFLFNRAPDYASSTGSASASNSGNALASTWTSSSCASGITPSAQLHPADNLCLSLYLWLFPCPFHFTSHALAATTFFLSFSFPASFPFPVLSHLCIPFELLTTARNRDSLYLSTSAGSHSYLSFFYLQRPSDLLLLFCPPNFPTSILFLFFISLSCFLKHGMTLF